MNNLRYTIKLDTKSGLLPQLKIIKQEMDGVTRSVKEAGGQFQKLTNICNELKNIKFSTIVSNVKDTAESLEKISAAGVEFEQGMADLQAITGIVGKDLETISKTARRVGKESGLGAKGAVDAFTLLASQIQIDKIGLKGLIQLQKETITLAQAGGMTLSDAATAMAATINQFGLEATHANRVVNVLAAGSKYGAAEVTDLAQSFKVTGATAAAAGLSVEQTAGALEVLSQSNVKGSEAGTALRNVILKLQTTLGMDLSKVGLADALDSLKPKLKDVTYLAKVFGSENIAAAQYLITNAKAVEEMTMAVTGTSVAQEQAAIRTNTLAEQTKRIQANIDDFKITLLNISGGLFGYASAVGETAVMISQSLPLLFLFKGAIATTAKIVGGGIVIAFVKLTAAAKASVAAMQGALVAAKAYSLTAQFMVGIFATLPGRVLAFTKALTLQKVATYAAAAAQKVLNIALMANPVGIVIAGITTLVAALVMAYKHCERFRRLIDSWVEGFKGLASWIGKAWDAVKKFFGFGSEMEETAGETAEAASAFGNLQDALKGSQDVLTDNKGASLDTIGGLKQKIKELSDAQEKASLSQAINLEKEIALYKERLNLLQRSIAVGASGHLGDTKYKEELKTPQTRGVDAPPSLDIPINFEVSENKIKENLMKMRQQFSDSIEEMVVFSEEQINGLVTSAFSGLGEAIASGSPLEMLKRMLITVMDMLQQFGSALIAAGAASEALKAVAWSGVGAIVAGGALVAATAAAKAALSRATAFAEGGIVSGPTLALVGEYGGASSNPEVIAPLDKLRSLIDTDRADGGVGEVRFEIRGDVLEGILKKVNNRRRRTR
jgi:TP901 family phage tail tape measure protein|nr:MAG TPA: minor tail protein [Caudoviricetes sp.]